MKCVYHEPQHPGSGGEIRTEPEHHPGLGMVDVVLAYIPPQDGSEAVHARSLVRSAKFHDELVELLTDVTNAATLPQLEAIKVKAVDALARIAAD